MMLRRVWLLLLAVAGACVIAILALTLTVQSQVANGRVYTLTELTRGLIHDRAAWFGRTIQLRAQASAAAPGMGDFIFFSSKTFYMLVVHYGHEDPLTGLLRRLPLVRSLAPQPQRVQFGAVATYRLRLQRPGPPCAATVSICVVLPDSAP